MDQPRTYTTSRIASAVGIHPNTVRLYERIGFITAPERLANGYRVFTDLHLLQVRLVRAALNVELVQNGLRREVLAIVETMASQRYDEAISLARQRIDHLRRERCAAEDALRHVRDLLSRSDGSARAERLMLTRKEAADQLDTTIDALRNWEMNGLLQVKRKQNGYRVYSAADLDRLAIIRALRAANYSLAAILRLLDALDRDATADIGHVLDHPDPDDDILVYCFRHFSRSGRALYLPFQIWDKGRVEGGGRRTTSWDLALDDRIAPPTRSVTWIRQDGRSGLDI